MEKAVNVSIFDQLGERVFTRITMQDFLSKISKLKEKKVVLDFKKVKFISRSCADEYLKFIQNTKKNVSSINQSSDVRMMIKAVENGLNALSISKINENSGCVLCGN
ncbi:MAG: hypothetical protein KKB21_05365 [Nanoarchaeota archaeon]|nr:hypothetical protein [Nanoarchaeota archaeon]MBU4086976.1 hypothetical protein [Nanoarchaeota archaeon]